jgi:DNA-binding GntR family transcriptional regulator
MTKYLSLKDHVYEFISEKISDGTLAPEGKISEQLICNELNISRTPVREALIQLCTEGYIENLPRKGFIVKHIDEKRAMELYTIIGSLEGLAAFLSINQITPDEINHMKYLVSAITAALDNNYIHEYYNLQMEFHNIYIDHCCNTELINLLNKLKRNFMKKSYLENMKNINKILKSTNDEHRIIIELFEKGNADDLQNYIMNVHWNTNSAIFDSF